MKRVVVAIGLLGALTLTACGGNNGNNSGSQQAIVPASTNNLCPPGMPPTMQCQAYSPYTYPSNNGWGGPWNYYGNYGYYNSNYSYYVPYYSQGFGCPYGYQPMY